MYIYIYNIKQQQMQYQIFVSSICHFFSRLMEVGDVRYKQKVVTYQRVEVLFWKPQQEVRSFIPVSLTRVSRATPTGTGQSVR